MITMIFVMIMVMKRTTTTTATIHSLISNQIQHYVDISINVLSDITDFGVCFGIS